VITSSRATISTAATFRLLDKVMRPARDQSPDFIDMRDLSRVRAAILPETRMIWLETPTNPMLKIFDIAAIAEIARKAGTRLYVDNTFATPILQRPLELGADVVIHSTTKYLNGHSDVVEARSSRPTPPSPSGSPSFRTRWARWPSPFDCYLVLRGLKTLGVRVRQQCATAAVIAERLSRHARVKRVMYPGLASHRSARSPRAR